MNRNRLPTFILIGAMKCGTTSLHRYLDAHPEICVSEPKETDFFLQRTEKDLSWYRRRFAREARAYGEASTNYTKYPEFRGVPQRMRQLLPEVKLLYLVRDPIERALSHYAHNRADGLEDQPLEEALWPPAESHYLQTSRYALQIAQYLEHYALDQLLVIEAERLRSERHAVLQAIFSFLEVTPTVESPAFAEEHHQTAGKLNPAASTFFQETRLGRMLKVLGKALLPQPAIEQSLTVLQSDVERPTIPDKLRADLAAYLQDDVQQLRTLTGNAFRSWSL